MPTSKIRRIGVLTGGGDCPGLNAVIRAVTKTAIVQYGIEVLGVEDAYLGLLEDRVRPLAQRDVSGILALGGTILGTTNKVNPMKYLVGHDEAGKPIVEDVSDRAVETCRKHGIDVLVCIGGDGTMAASYGMVKLGIPVVGVPKTIDNDLMCTDITFGFTTAAQTATEALDRIRTTASSHHRIMLVELMGRNAGWLTLHAGLAAGADVILIPEIPYDLNAVCGACTERKQSGKRFTIVTVSEGARPIDGEQVGVLTDDPVEPLRLGGIAERLARQVADRTGMETRATILGHVQRGGTPCAYDRVLATHFGHAALHLAATGEWNRMVAWQDGVITAVPLEQVAGKQRLVPHHHPLVTVARHLGVSFGESC
jgi:phosphofructokinase-like protein